jgi:hypothetical protein
MMVQKASFMMPMATLTAIRLLQPPRDRGVDVARFHLPRTELLTTGNAPRT